MRYELIYCFVCKLEKFSPKISLQSSQDAVVAILHKYINNAPSDFALASSLQVHLVS